jgi:predicted transcriptional regulator
MNVLLSIKPKYAESILNGAKLFEFRRKIFRKRVDYIYLYSTYPIKKIVGYFKVSAIEEGSPEELWAKFRASSGLSKKDFFEYFKNTNKGYAIRICNAVKLETPINPVELMPGFRAPQSFKYVNNIISNKEAK